MKKQINTNQEKPRKPYNKLPQKNIISLLKKKKTHSSPKRRVPPPHQLPRQARCQEAALGRSTAALGAAVAPVVVGWQVFQGAIGVEVQHQSLRTCWFGGKDVLNLFEFLFESLRTSKRLKRVVGLFEVTFEHVSETQGVVLLSCLFKLRNSTSFQFDVCGCVLKMSCLWFRLIRYFFYFLFLQKAWCHAHMQSTGLSRQQLHGLAVGPGAPVFYKPFKNQSKP